MTCALLSVSVCKATPRIGAETPDAEILINEQLPEFGGNGWQQRCAQFYDDQAERLEVQLHVSLPGGTYSSLLERMLRRRACHFRVSFGGVTSEEVET